MNINLVTGYPKWFILLCLVTGVVFAAILYYRESKNEFSNVLKWILAIFRALTVALLSFLLLNPLFKTISRYSEKPVIIFAQDNSSSIITNPDSMYYLNEYMGHVNDFLDQIGNSFSIDKYSFGDVVSERFQIDFNEKMTDFSGLFSEIHNKYSHRNVGALVIASDGIYNRGINPLYTSDKFNFPIYTIALGDTNLQRDIILTKISYNRIAYLGNEFPVEINIKANKCINNSTQVIVAKKDTVLFKKNIAINSDNYFETINLKLKAVKPGVQKYRITILPIDNEISHENNYQDIFIEILEGKQNILLLAQAPDPDISALKQALGTNINYDIKDQIIDEFDKQPGRIDLLILHGLPSAKNPIPEILDQSDDLGIPILYIITPQTSLFTLNNRNTGITIKGSKISYNESQPAFNEVFSSFRLSGSTLQTISNFPPLISPYGNNFVNPNARVLFYQKIGSVITDFPLIAFNEHPDSKSGYILGSGIWKWRMINFAREGNHEAFNELINKIIQFLSAKIDRSFFRVYTKNSFSENEDVELEAEVYNDNYELINDSEVNITITDSQNNKYPYVFTQTEKGYHLNVKKLPADNYTYFARVNRNDKVLTDNGEFVVASTSIEKNNTVANHNLLYNLATSTGGEMVYPDYFNDLLNTLKKREDIKPIVFAQKKYSELLNFPLLMIILITLLSIEWLIRKRAGGY